MPENSTMQEPKTISELTAKLDEHKQRAGFALELAAFVSFGALGVLVAGPLGGIFGAVLGAFVTWLFFNKSSDAIQCVIRLELLRTRSGK